MPSMPFERYLNPPPPPPAFSDGELVDSSRAEALGIDDSTFSSHVQFQLPQLILGPTLATGGGAEVLPAGLVGNSSALASTWLGTPAFPFSSRVHTEKLFGSDFTLSPETDQRPLSFSPTLSWLNSSNNTRTLPPSDSTSNDTVAPQPPPAIIDTGPIPVAIPLAVPSALGLPVYSASGFDLLGILARVVTRPYPKIILGPVDMTCSFAVVDTRRFDSPIVYASPTFYKLTGYSEQEVIGRNCRFLQSPDGQMAKGEPRRYTAPESVGHLRKSLGADKECQVSLINYRKGGAAFINLVTVIPVPGGVNNTPEEADEVVYHVGFQVDLTEQPNAILQKLRDGSYMVDYSNNSNNSTITSATRDWKASSTSLTGVSKQFRSMMNDKDFLRSIPLSTSTTTLALPTQDKADKSDPYDGNRLLSLLLLEKSPDFVHVLSLKGTFLYVAPSVRTSLGFEPEDLVGKAITDFCHPADTVPLMRELKESSAVPGASTQSLESPSSSHMPMSTPKVVDLLFRMKNKDGEFVWMESRGRLHVEPGKGRKAIILSGRTRQMPALTWGPIARAGGLAPSVAKPISQAEVRDGEKTPVTLQDREFWVLLSQQGSFLFVSAGIRDVLGWGVGEIIGRRVGDLIGGQHSAQTRQLFEVSLNSAFAKTQPVTRSVPCELKRKDGTLVLVDIVLYRSQAGSSFMSSPIHPNPTICQVRLSSSLPSSQALTHSFDEDVFEELNISRGSSWQYELQQLKFANQRLMEELEEVETSLRDDKTTRTEKSRYDTSFETAWTNQLQGIGNQHNVNIQSQLPSKRSWDATGDGG